HFSIQHRRKTRMHSMRKLSAAITALALLPFVFSLSSCGSGGPGKVEGTVTLQGAGASFPDPLYKKWISEYGKLHPNIKIDYQSIGSGGGIKQIVSQTVDFGASDSPMKDEDLQKAPGSLLHIPTVLGAVVLTYNLVGVTEQLRF